jgi:chromosome segregation ATPase
LVQPSIDEEKYANSLETLQYELARQKTRADRAENRLVQAQQTIVKLQTDVEAGLDLAAETEHQNGTLRKEVHRYSCWIEKLKAKIEKLIQQRAQQEEEMLKIADAVEQQEIRLKNGVAKLTQLSAKLSPKLQRDLQKIIRYLKEDNS